MRYQVRRYNKWKFSVICTFSYVNNIEHLEQWINYKAEILSAIITLLGYVIGAAFAFICVDSLIDLVEPVNTINLKVFLIIMWLIIKVAMITITLSIISLKMSRHSSFYKEILYILQDLK